MSGLSFHSRQDSLRRIRNKKTSRTESPHPFAPASLLRQLSCGLQSAVRLRQTERVFVFCAPAAQMPIAFKRLSGIKNVQEFHYVRMVVEEALRMYPPTYSLSRKPLQDDEIEGYRIPKDAYVYVPIINCHYDKRWWSELEKFIPERFAPDKRQVIERFVYFPFGGGPRICIGNSFALLDMQIAVIIFYRLFRFKLQEGFTPTLEPLVTLKPKNGMMMRVERRGQNLRS